MGCYARKLCPEKKGVIYGRFYFIFLICDERWLRCIKLQIIEQRTLKLSLAAVEQVMRWVCIETAFVFQCRDLKRSNLFAMIWHNMIWTIWAWLWICDMHLGSKVVYASPKICFFLYMSQLMRLWHFSSSVNSFFKHACAAIQWGYMSEFWSDPSSTVILHVCEQWRLWRDYADAQVRLSLRWSPMR